MSDVEDLDGDIDDGDGDIDGGGADTPGRLLRRDRGMLSGVFILPGGVSAARCCSAADKKGGQNERP